jgi:hypothetical protein
MNCIYKNCGPLILYFNFRPINYITKYGRKGKDNSPLHAEQFEIDPKINLKKLQLPKDSIYFPDTLSIGNNQQFLKY